jgi:hypothetical protein
VHLHTLVMNFVGEGVLQSHDPFTALHYTGVLQDIRCELEQVSGMKCPGGRSAHSISAVTLHA